MCSTESVYVVSLTDNGEKKPALNANRQLPPCPRWIQAIEEQHLRSLTRVSLSTIRACHESHVQMLTTSPLP